MHGYDEKKSIDKLVEWQRIPLFDPYFLALGSINPRKNSYNLLKTFIDYKDEGKITSDLVFAGVLGKGWSRKERSFITACFRRSDVHYLGRVSESEKDALLFNANALVYPSLLEGFGLVLLEAAQFNCPVLTSESSVCQEVLAGYTNQEGVIYIDPYSSESIGQGLTEVERIQKGPSLERNRTWDEVACELWEVLIGKINE
jgi:glycosyltransferase involved in cell wall biosynthesis